MTSLHDCDELTRSTRRIEFRDGLQDFQNAITFLLLGSIGGLTLSEWGMEFYLRAWIFKREFATLGLIGLFALFLLAVFGLRRLMHWIRRRYLWPSRGHVEPLKWQVNRSASVLSVAIWMVVFLLGIVVVDGAGLKLEQGMRAIAGASGVATAVLFYSLGHDLRLIRYQWVAAAGALLSLAILFLPLTSSESWLFFGLFWATMLLISGGYALYKSSNDLRGDAHD